MWRGALVVALLTIAAHWQGLCNQFVEWDDGPHITRNVAIRALTLENLRRMFTGYEAKLYLPLTWLSFAVDYQVWGRDPFGYHLTNLLLHLANTLLVLLLVYRILQNRCEFAAQVAVLVAAFFGVHPLRVESVAWATERKDVLFALFFLLALNAYLRWVAEGRRSAYWSCFVLFIASLLSKSTAVTFPVVLLLLDALLFRRHAWNEKAPFFIAGIILGAATVAAQSSGTEGTVVNLQMIPAWARVGLLGYCAVFYVWKFFWPFHLSAVYPSFNEMNWSWLDATGWLAVFTALTAVVSHHPLSHDRSHSRQLSRGCRPFFLHSAACLGASYLRRHRDSSAPPAAACGEHCRGRRCCAGGVRVDISQR